jgi:hypothetical protein
MNTLMQSPNPFEPPASALETTVRPAKSNAFPFVRALLLVWVVASPIVWWKHFYSAFGVQAELSFMLQPVALAAIGLLATPLLWRASAKAAIALVALAIAIALSIILISTVFSDGTLFNAGLLSAFGIITWHKSRRLSHASREA